MLTAPFSELRPSLEPRFDHEAWVHAPEAPLTRSWRGEEASAALATTARLCWTTDELWVGFECRYAQLDVDVQPNPAVERYGLWERDVCEAFIQSPREASPDSYKEFEVAPTGQWFDVAIRHPRTDVDWTWDAGLATAAAIDVEARIWRAVMRVPWAAFGGAPVVGEIWRANLFRIGRLEGARQFLAYAPTGTPAPDFHLPAAFVPLVFTEPADCR